MKGPTVEGDEMDCHDGGAGHSRVMNGTDCRSALEKQFPPLLSHIQTRSTSCSSAGNNMKSQHDFSTTLVGLLDEEAQRQADRQRRTYTVFYGELYMEVSTTWNLHRANILTHMTISIDQQGIEALILLYGQLLFAPISGVGNPKNQMAPIINCLLWSLESKLCDSDATGHVLEIRYWKNFGTGKECRRSGATC